MRGLTLQAHVILPLSGCAAPKDRAGDSQRGGAAALTTRTMLSKARMGDEGKAAGCLVWAGGFAV
jgi:hypothetical protein